MEEDFPTKAMLMNALSHLHLKVGGRRQLAIDHLNKSLNIQQDDANDESTDANLLIETMILYGNAMASENSFSQAIDWYDSALSSNPNKSALHPSNLRAWYNKGVTLFRNGDNRGAVQAFGIITEETKKNSTTAPVGIGPVLNAIGSIHFRDRNFAGAVQRFTDSLSLKNECRSPCQRAGVLCNIATAYFGMKNYEESEKYLEEALVLAESFGEMSSHLKATIMCKLAYIFYKRKRYPRAHSLFSDGKNLACKV
jgi:tetratricopeptide (TPR) repeat protein